MSVLESLVRIKDLSSSKSYFTGLERGRIWAENHADYFEIREWSEANHEEFDDLILPGREREEFYMIDSQSRMDWRAYLKGWLEGVREIREKY